MAVSDSGHLLFGDGDGVLKVAVANALSASKTTSHVSEPLVLLRADLSYDKSADPKRHRQRLLGSETNPDDGSATLVFSFSASVREKAARSIALETAYYAVDACASVEGDAFYCAAGGQTGFLFLARVRTSA